jgi:trimeric autotransporter adhesin
MIFRVPSHLLQTVAFVWSAWACMGQPQGVTRIMYNDPSVTYTGAWYLNHETPNIGGSATLTNSKGATAALSFTGTGITWIGVLDQYSGLAQVYLDGTPNTVDTYGANTQYGQPLFSVHGLAAGTHTLSIQVLHQRDGLTSGSWIWINAFDIENGSGIAGGVSASSGHIEQNDPAITYTGNWYLNTNPSMSGGSAVLATDVNSSATVSFTGTGISWIGYQDQWSGLANIYVDGALQTPQVDTYASPQKVQSTVYSINNLSPGTHTLMIVVTGTHSAASAGSWIWIDAFNIAGSS